jgi:hypothetical protein
MATGMKWTSLFRALTGKAPSPGEAAAPGTELGEVRYTFHLDIDLPSFIDPASGRVAPGMFNHFEMLTVRPVWEGDPPPPAPDGRAFVAPTGTYAIAIVEVPVDRLPKGPVHLLTVFRDDGDRRCPKPWSMPMGRSKSGPKRGLFLVPRDASRGETTLIDKERFQREMEKFVRNLSAPR